MGKKINCVKQSYLFEKFHQQFVYFALLEISAEINWKTWKKYIEHSKCYSWSESNQGNIVYYRFRQLIACYNIRS